MGDQEETKAVDTADSPVKMEADDGKISKCATSETAVEAADENSANSQEHLRQTMMVFHNDAFFASTHPRFTLQYCSKVRGCVRSVIGARTAWNTG